MKEARHDGDGSRFFRGINFLETLQLASAISPTMIVVIHDELAATASEEEGKD